MSWEMTSKSKYKLPDGSVFVIENWERDITSQYDDFNGDDEAIYNDTHEERVHFENNKGNWEWEHIYIEHPNWVKSYTTYQFKNKNKVIKLCDCKQIKD